MKYNTKADLEKAAESLEQARAIADTARNDGERTTLYLILLKTLKN